MNEELVELLGGNSEGLRYASPPPMVLMLVGLQGSGKTTTAVKLALLARREGHQPLVAGLDLRRPAAEADRSPESLSLFLRESGRAPPEPRESNARP